MQLTRFDRWLKETFVYETQILTLRPAEVIPRKIRQVELPEKAGRRYKHLYTTGNAKAADALLKSLRDENQMFTTKIVDKDAWWVQFMAPEGKSPSWYLISVFLLMAGLTPVVIWIRGLLQSPEFIKNMQDTLEIIKG